MVSHVTHDTEDRNSSTETDVLHESQLLTQYIVYSYSWLEESMPQL